MTKSSNFVEKRRKWLHWKDSKWVKRRNERKEKTFGAAPWKLLKVNGSTQKVNKVSTQFQPWYFSWSPFYFKVQVRPNYEFTPFYSFTPNFKPITLAAFQIMNQFCEGLISIRDIAGNMRLRVLIFRFSYCKLALTKSKSKILKNLPTSIMGGINFQRVVLMAPTLTWTLVKEVFAKMYPFTFRIF